MKILTVDAGNSQLAMVLYQDDRRISSVRIRTHPFPGVDDIVSVWSEQLREQSLEAGDVVLCISSVVPKLETTLRAAALRFAASSFHWVSWESTHEFEAPESAQKEIGADLIAGLVGARAWSKEALVVIDCGTATTLTLVNDSNFILGVAILPGLVTQLLSLTHSAPHLPQDISLRPPPKAFGADTHSALQSGILYSHAAAIDGLIENYRSELDSQNLLAVACGGLYHRVSSLCLKVDREEAELVNVGCRILAQRQVQEGL